MESSTVVSLQGDIELFSSLFVKKEVLGKSFDIQVAGHTGKLVFPIFDLKTDYSFKEFYDSNSTIRNYSLTSPKMIYGGKNNWGRVVSWPDLSCQVDRLALMFEFQNEFELEKRATDIHESIPKFLKRFVECYEFETHHILSKVSLQSFSEESVIFYSVNKEGNRVFSVNPGKINVTVNIPGSFSDSTTFEKPIAFANGIKEIRLEHIMLNKSILALQSKEYRLCIMELASSFELGLKSALRNHLSSKNETGIIDYIVDKKTLGSLREFAVRINFDLIDDTLIKAMINDRNNCIHHGQTPLESNLRKYIELISRWNRINVPFTY